MKKIIFSVMMFNFLLFMSCQDILECVINRHPELSNKTLAIAQLNQSYFETIEAEIKNEPLDNSYNYFFSIDGSLPRGITTYADNRTLVIEGVPLQTGTYNFTVRLTVSQKSTYGGDCANKYNDCDGLCAESTKQNYTILVN